MSMATSLEKRIKDAAKNLGSGGSPMPVNVIRNHEEPVPPTPTVTYWTVTFADATTPPVSGISMPAPVQIEDKQLIDGDQYSPDPSSGTDLDEQGWEFKIWSKNGVESNKFQVTSDMTLTAVYQYIQNPTPSLTIDSDTQITVSGMEGATVSFITPTHADATIGGSGSAVVSDLSLSDGDDVSIVVSFDGYKDVELTETYEEPTTPDMNPLPSGAVASSAGGYYIQGMNGASVEFSSNGTTLSSGTIDQESSGTYYYRDSDTSDLPAVGTTLDITVSLSGYKTWTGTVAVTGGK